MDLYHIYSFENLYLKTHYSKKVGDLGQDAAETYLTGAGYTLIGKNIRIGNYGEIDLIFKTDKGRFLFIEVKSSFTNKPSLDCFVPISRLGTKRGDMFRDGFAQIRDGEPMYSAYERVSRKKKLRLRGLVERYCYKNSIDLDENIDIYLAHITLFSKELTFKEFGMEEKVNQKDILINLYYKPQFFKLE